jgi:hypothetical protein
MICHQCRASNIVPPALTPGEAGGDEADGDADPEEHTSDDDMDGGVALDPSQPFQIGGGFYASEPECLRSHCWAAPTLNPY